MLHLSTNEVVLSIEKAPLEINHGILYQKYPNFFGNTFESNFDKKENFEKLTKMFANLKGEKYSLNSIDKILNEIDKIVLNEQYEFLNSTVNEEFNDNLINLTFNVVESEKFYVSRINILGNFNTVEEVIRHQLIIDEGDAFNEILHNKTINKLKDIDFSLPGISLDEKMILSFLLNLILL